MKKFFVDVQLKKQYLLPKLCVGCGSPWDAPHFTHPISHPINTKEKLSLSFPVCSDCGKALQKGLEIEHSGKGRLPQAKQKRLNHFLWSFSIEEIKPKSLFRKTPIIVFSFTERRFAEAFAELNHGKLH